MPASFLSSSVVRLTISVLYLTVGAGVVGKAVGKDVGVGGSGVAVTVGKVVGVGDSVVDVTVAVISTSRVTFAVWVSLTTVVISTISTVGVVLSHAVRKNKTSKKAYTINRLWCLTFTVYLLLPFDGQKFSTPTSVLANCTKPAFFSVGLLNVKQTIINRDSTSQ